ncbi:UvrD-helicase domain-containing protein [Luedemannella helvata]|uniref:DNA 3'-5' helicase n=1 Tax=Luedemannella helvata TaxID=349315 RepID=A0ABN2KYW9_9ACTN
MPPLTQDPFVADLHIHSKYSRACSRDLELENLAWWARRKGITVLGTGDFTHPAWYDHLRENLVPDETAPGLYRLSGDAEAAVLRRLPGSVTEGHPVRFMLSVEISTIYSRDGRTRKVHHLIYLPDLDAVARFNARLGRGEGGLGGNLGSDGRPIIGLDSRDLLEVVLEASPDGFLVPAHIWTPWFSALGSKSGFDAIADCYADLAHHIKAVETGLSSDPEMNWRVSSLDAYQLLSNSDAHSPQALAREATLLTSEINYAGVRRAMESGDGLHGTIEFFPEEGKYHADGHRACGVNWPPQRTRDAGGRCPECGKPLTVGVLSRVEDLADRPADFAPEGRPGVTHLVQLAEILGEINGVGPKSKSVAGRISSLVAALGPELHILMAAPLADVTRHGGELLGEAIGRLRRGEVRRTPGYDGEYGVIRLFAPGELNASAGGADALFDLPTDAVAPRQQRRAAPARSAPAKAGRTTPAEPVPAPGEDTARPRDAVPPASAAPPPTAPPQESPHKVFEPVLAGMEEVGTGLLDRLDALQRVAASAPGGPLLVVAGPGTGKTRTLTHRIAYLCAELNVDPKHCLAITFTRRAAEEMRERLESLLGEVAEDITVNTFHALGLQILREQAGAAGLEDGFGIADDAVREAARTEAGDDDNAYRKILRAQNLVDLDELVSVPVALLRDDPDLVDRYQARWRWVFVDEYQDVDATQYELLRLLVPPDGNICAIGDPDQAIYSFRGADVGYFLRFSQDFSDARLVRLARNYRSSAPILAAAVQAIAPTSLVRGRRLDPARLDPDAPQLGLHAAATPAAEAEWLARTVDGLVGGVSHRSFDGGRVDSRAATGTVTFADIAVLYRTDAQAGPVLEALSRAGIPVQKRSHDRLADRRAVAEIARELRFAGNTTGPLTDRVRAAGRALATRTPRLFDEQPRADLPAADVYGAVDLLMPLAERCGDDVEAFLQALATGAETDALDPRAQAVTLLTLHAAKGLEWPVVFLVGCEDGLLPLRFPGTAPDPEAVAEERRLFFVGMTRARDRLFLSHAARRQRFGAETTPARTPFLDVVDPSLVERLGVAEAPRKPSHRQLRLI